MMETRKILTILVLALGLLVCWAEVSEAGPMGTAFTYQGRLTDANNAANGQYDFQFKLYDANSGPNQVGGDVNVPGVDVMDGYFTVELDFGAVFDGDARWLEIAVRSWDPCDVNAFARLLPRQELTPTPYAIYAGNAGDAGTLDGLDSLDLAGAVHTHDAAHITSGTLNVACYSAHGDLSVEGYLGNAPGNLAQNNGILQPTLNADMVDGLHGGAFAPSGHAHNAADITSGTLNVARYSARSDLSVEGYLGNSGGDIAQNNGVLQSTLNADMVDGLHAGSFLTSGSDYGRSGVSSTLYEGSTPLSSKYLGISATATNSDRLDGYHSSSFAWSSHNHSAGNITSGTLSTSRYSAISDLSAEGYLGNASGDLAQNNGTVQTNLNADKLDGYHASSFATGSHNHDSRYINDSGAEIDNVADFDMPFSMYWNSTLGNTMFEVRRNYSGGWATGAAIGGVSGGGKNAVSAVVGDGSGDAITADNWGSGYAIEAWSGHGNDYVARFMSNSGSSGKGVYIQGYLTATGTKSSIVETSAGQEALFAIESPEVEFCCSGSASLTVGEAAVSFDRLFAEAISQVTPIKVLVTPTTECNGMYVALKSHEGFTVRELQGGTSNAGFDWIAIGTRKGYESRPNVSAVRETRISKPNTEIPVE